MKNTLLVTALTIASCADAPMAVDLALVQDPDLNRVEDVLERVTDVVVIVDAPGGLYAPGEERTVGLVQIEDADADRRDLELVATVPIEGSRLPVIRLERGTLPDVPLDIRVLGLGSEPRPIAEGRVRAVRLSRPPAELSVPFNIRPEALPPRVSEVLPADGDEAGDCVVPDIVLLFSKPIDAATLVGAVVLDPGGPVDVTLDASGHVATFAARLSGDGETVSFRLRVDSTVTDRQGVALDQLPAEPGRQPFDEAFVLPCGPGTAVPGGPCGTDTGPLPGECPGGDRLACVDGECVLDGCDRARCREGFACVEATGVCEVDCRLYGEVDVCPEDRPRCDPDSGACVP